MNVLSRQNKLYFEFPKVRKKREIKIQRNPQNINLTSKVLQNWRHDVKNWRHDGQERGQHLTAESSCFHQWKQLIYLKLDWRYWIVIYQKMTNSNNDWCFWQMSSRQRKTIGFEIIFLKNMSDKKILKVIKFQGKNSSTREIKTKNYGVGVGSNWPPPDFDRVKDAPIITSP